MTAVIIRMCIFFELGTTSESHCGTSYHRYERIDLESPSLADTDDASNDYININVYNEITEDGTCSPDMYDYDAETDEMIEDSCTMTEDTHSYIDVYIYKRN